MDMGSTGVKFSGGKIVPHSVLRAGTTSWHRLKHRDIFTGTWNVRTLYSSGALEILTRELDQSLLDLVALQEVRWPGEGSQESGSFTLFYGGAERPEFGTVKKKKKSHTLLAKFIQRLQEGGTFTVNRADCGAPRKHLTPDFEEDLLHHIEETPSMGSCTIVHGMGVPHSTIWEILHVQQLHPYHPQMVYAMCPANFACRTNFYIWFLHCNKYSSPMSAGSLGMLF